MKIFIERYITWLKETVISPLMAHNNYEMQSTISGATVERTEVLEIIPILIRPCKNETELYQRVDRHQ